MKLKRLEIQGFKSFPDRTVFKFLEDGMTAVVGPNGCGKSNIVDAVRWALGEQSAKLLRGQMMEDVIFNGSERRKPVGMAEVTLLFENNGTAEGQWRDFAEISVSRKLYRTGESEYSINGIPCRLKDVRELLADAGSSSRGYSIVEQGRISLLINSKPEEKRALIEEAAGVLKYRMRRIEAERKLERTGQNLLRVNDVLREIKRQLESLKRSAAKARRYRRLREDLEGLVLRFRFEEYRRLEMDLLAVQKELQARSAELQTAETALAGLEAREEELRLALASGEEQVNSGYESVRSMEAEMARLEGDISVRESAIQSLAERLERLAQDREELLRQGQDQENERVQLQLELESIANEHRRHVEELEAARESHGTAEAELGSARRDLEGTRSALFSLGTERNRLEADLQAAGRTGETLSRRLEDGRERERSLEARISQLRAGLGQKRAGFEAACLRRDGQSTQLQEVRGLLAGTGEELRAIDVRMAEAAERQAELRGLQRTLAAMDEQMEGFSDGVRNVLKDYAGTGASGVVGVVADYLEVPQPYEKAVVALLGERLQHVIVDKPENGQSAIDYLKERSRGRGGFIPKHPRGNGNGNGKGNGSLHQVKGEGVLGPLTDLVGFSGEMNGVGDFLLGGALLVEDLTKALSLWRRNGFTATMVTLEGDVVEPTGVITGGTFEAEESTPLARKRRLKEVREASAAAEVEINSLRERRDSLRQGLASLEGKTEALAVDLREAERKCMDEESALAAAEREVDHLQLTFDDVRAETSLLAAEQEELVSRMGQYRSRLDEVIVQEEAARQRLTALESLAHKASVLLEERRLDLEEARLRVNTVSLRKESSERALETARSRTQEMEQRAERIRTDSSEAQGRIEAHRAEIHRGRQALSGMIQTLDGGKEKLLRLREVQEGTRSEADSLAHRAREMRSAAAEVRQQCSTKDIRIHELRAELQHLVDRVMEEHGLSIAQVDAERFGDGEFDRQAAQERIADLRQRISGLGEVNPGAVEQFEELNTRYEFMNAQKDDLEKSIDTLNKAIRKINRTSREKFQATFAEVQKNFSQLFPRLFEGGTAEMVLLDENDPLNTGVEIQVRLPGKKLRSMQLLSGGEKALVSLTMILSLFLVKPSPFCILDEVDAPLDDDNLGTFARIVKEMAANFQFLVITHNKLTMETADVLYGITMREPGVSQVVSVRLRDVA